MPRPESSLPRRTITVPNVLTSLRIVMAIAAAAAFAVGYREREAFAVCVAAALLDVFDGWYARRFAQRTYLGEHLDPLADKILMAVVFGVVAARADTVLVWVPVALIAVREAGITILRSVSFRRHGRYIPANGLGKLKMVVQSAVGLTILGVDVVLEQPLNYSGVVVAASLAGILAVSAVSAFAYIRQWRAPAVGPGGEIAVGAVSQRVVGE